LEQGGPDMPLVMGMQGSRRGQRGRRDDVDEGKDAEGLKRQNSKTLGERGGKACKTAASIYKARSPLLQLVMQSIAACVARALEFPRRQ
jgi:hypothetical protein